MVLCGGIQGFKSVKNERQGAVSEIDGEGKTGDKGQRFRMGGKRMGLVGKGTAKDERSRWSSEERKKLVVKVERKRCSMKCDNASSVRRMSGREKTKGRKKL